LLPWKFGPSLLSAIVHIPGFPVAVDLVTFGIKTL
jgi:hypothetical protein